MAQGELFKMVDYGCYLLTTASGNEINGMPLSLFMQVCTRPAMVAVGIHPDRYTHKMVKDSRTFAVIFLRKDQKELVEKFKLESKNKADKFEGLEWSKGVSGAPILKDCAGYIECRVQDQLFTRGHTIFSAFVVEEKIVKPGALLMLSDLGESYPG